MENSTDQSLNDISVSRVEGVYLNKAEHPYDQGNSLWSRLFYRSKESEELEHGVVKLKLVGSRELHASLVLNDSILAIRVIRFKFTKGYLNLRRQIKAKMFVGPIIWGLGDSKVYIGISQNNDLVLINTNVGVGMLLFMPVLPAGGQRDADFKRVSE